MKKFATAMALVAGAMTSHMTFANTLPNLTVDDYTNFNGNTNVLNSRPIKVIGGTLTLSNPSDAGEKFDLKYNGIAYFRDGGTYFDNRALGSLTVFRTSENSDRDHDTLTLYANGDVEVDNTLSAAVVEIRGAGNDLAESFKVNNPVDQVKSGMIVSIDPANPGEMTLSNSEYDSKVAGVINGAGGLHAGVHLGDVKKASDGYRQVALTGRVYVKANALNGAIKPGDMLTTSKVPGQAMKVTDHVKAQGSVIGKAMTPINPDTGLVLVLVSLQ